MLFSSPCPPPPPFTIFLTSFSLFSPKWQATNLVLIAVLYPWKHMRTVNTVIWVTQDDTGARINTIRAIEVDNS